MDLVILLANVKLEEVGYLLLAHAITKHSLVAYSIAYSSFHSINYTGPLCWFDHSNCLSYCDPMGSFLRNKRVNADRFNAFSKTQTKKALLALLLSGFVVLIGYVCFP